MRAQEQYVKDEKRGEVMMRRKDVFVRKTRACIMYLWARGAIMSSFPVLLTLHPSLFEHCSVITFDWVNIAASRAAAAAGRLEEALD